MKANSLFRQEALEHRKNYYFGAVSINAPIGYQILSIGALSLILCILFFLTFAELSEKFVVSGFLNSTKGIIHVYPSKPGIILHSYIQLGTKVKKGDKLFVIDTSFNGLTKVESQALYKRLEHRKKIIEDEMNYKKKQLAPLKELLEKKYISVTTYDQIHQELVNLENDKNQIDMEMIKYRQDKAYIIHAPIDGIITSVIYKTGQYTQSTKPLVKILPDNAKLIAELFVPIDKSSTLDKSKKLLIRYTAYPYEHFGAYPATIKEINQSILTDEEEDKPIKVGQPYYKVIATLDKPYVSINGHTKRVQQGMTVTAVFVGPKRKIWQWIIDPFSNFYRELSA